MGFFTRHLYRAIVPRPVRRVARLGHPVRMVRRAVTPRPVRRALWAAQSPLDFMASQAVDQRAPKGVFYYHGTCHVHHRTIGAAQRCTKG